MRKAKDKEKNKGEKSDAEPLMVIIETPRNSRNKYKYDPISKMFEFESTLKGGLCYPFDFGFVPSTLAEDGDPLDVIVFMDQLCTPGCSIAVRLLGVMEAEQTEKGKTIRNDRLLGVHAKSILFTSYKDWNDIALSVREDIELFFQFSNMTKNRQFEVIGWRGVGESELLLKKARKLFQKLN